MSPKASATTAAATATAIAVALAICVPAGGAAPARPAKLTAPVIHETFTPLPCSGTPNGRNTLQQEGCAEQQILRTDAVINTRAESIFGRLHDDASKSRFIAAQQAWISFRRADCLSLSDVFEGGTQAPVLDAQCQAARNAQRVGDLGTFLTDLGGDG